MGAEGDIIKEVQQTELAHDPAPFKAIVACPRMQRSPLMTLYATGERRAELTHVTTSGDQE